MIRRFLICPLLIVIFHLLQYVIVPYSYNGVSPDYLLLLVVSVAVFEIPQYAAIYGLAAGLLSDYSAAVGFGTRAMAFMLLSWALSYFVHKSLTTGILTNTISVLAVYVITRLVYWCEYLINIGTFSLTDMLLNVVLPEIIMTVLLSPVVFLIVKLALGNGSQPKQRR